MFDSSLFRMASVATLALLIGPACDCAGNPPHHYVQGAGTLSGEQAPASSPTPATSSAVHQTVTDRPSERAEIVSPPESGHRVEALMPVISRAWHEPVAPLEPANRAATGIMETIGEIDDRLTETSYQHRTSVSHRRGVYRWDCSGMTQWILEREAPDAFQTLDEERAVARDFFDMLEDSPTHRARHGWQRIERPDQIAPGDLFAWRKPDIFRDRPGTGHVGFVLETPQPHPDHEDVWVMRIADSTRYPHENDSRQYGDGGGFGSGTMAFIIDSDGMGVAYGWYGSGQDPATFIHTPVAFGRVSR